jgi:hypothetical protein
MKYTTSIILVSKSRTISNSFIAAAASGSLSSLISIESANKGIYPPGFERALLQFKISKSDTTFKLLERIPTLVSQRPTVVSKLLISRYGNVQFSDQMLGQRLFTDHNRVSNLGHEIVDATCCLLRESEASTVVLRREKTQATGYSKQGGGR